MTQHSALHELKIKEEDLEAKRREVIEECIKACEHAQFNYPGGAPDYQGGAEACIAALKALKDFKKSLLTKQPEPMPVVEKPTPPAGRLVCEWCGELPPNGKHPSWMCKFVDFLDSL